MFFNLLKKSILHYQTLFMKKITLLLLVATIFCFGQAKAQKLVFLFGHAEYISPMGELKDSHKGGVGVEGGVGLGKSKTFFTLTTGYSWIKKQNNTAGEATGDLVHSSLKLGIRRYIVLKNVFIKGDVGYASIKPIEMDVTRHFTAVVGAGVKFAGFEVLADYTTVTAWGSWIGVKAGFAIGL